MFTPHKGITVLDICIIALIISFCIAIFMFIDYKNKYLKQHYKIKQHKHPSKLDALNPHAARFNPIGGIATGGGWG